MSTLRGPDEAAGPRQPVPAEVDGQLPLWTLAGTVRALQLVQADERAEAIFAGARTLLQAVQDGAGSS